jgi:ADP-ribosylglycohydrolase
LHAIEEVPIALAMFVVTAGDPVQTILGGVNYGRDCDSIAGMGGAVAGALRGLDALPEAWRRTVSEGSHKDFDAPARALVAVACELLDADGGRIAGRKAALVENLEHDA